MPMATEMAAKESQYPRMACQLTIPVTPASFKMVKSHPALLRTEKVSMLISLFFICTLLSFYFNVCCNWEFETIFYLAKIKW